jgi:predicted dehydrogenase
LFKNITLQAYQLEQLMVSMEKIKWGIIGPGSIANNFADGLKGSYSGQLVSIASKNDDRRKNFGDKYDIHPDFRFDNYDDIINSEHIDAIYISTPHTLHAEWTIKAAGKGKHVLCEKPGAVNLKEGKKNNRGSKRSWSFLHGRLYVSMSSSNSKTIRSNKK